MKTIAILIAVLSVTACSTSNMLNGKPAQESYVSKATFCYQLPTDQAKPGQNCIGSGGHGN
ncbi:hypothetical protein HYE54_12425 [Aggregatibacter actinomycetemcomitans]|uniref:hypothetical protein n=1 Tax=Aggregatibacter actinomycetemcomitans TaxID=714 RepID=UPI00197B370F|nr:hypothetical protein [Aggregatibacter actinomycetemcomitans]MBN6069496.1 hypothetical protein [Aggregatibacter actinomycetemcomitans]MBN6087066.1 hypothetical protein [Aggregatibacter actinomycetemcomitans]